LVTKAECGDGERAVITKDYFSLVVPDADRPCPTITATGASAGAASVTHPWECRKLTPSEALSVSGFPRGFRLVGSREERYERVGRAVMPPLYEAVGQTIAEALP
jgi:DNA (cytosine-5)-methyltransferase 1